MSFADALVRLAALVDRRPGVALAGALGLALAGAAMVPGLEIASSRFGLIDPSGEVERGLARYGAQGDLVIAVTSDEPEAGRAAVDTIADAMREVAGSDAVWHRLDPEVLRGRELDLASPEQVDRAFAAARPGTPRGLGGVLDAALSGLGADGATLDDLEEERAPAARPEDLTGLARLLDGLGAEPATPPPYDDAGYLASDDRRTRFVFVSPRGTTDRVDEVAPLVDAARRAAERARRDGVEVALTGYPALAVEEVEAIRAGTVTTGIASGVLVLLLFALGFRSRAGIVMAGLPLGIGMAWAFGAVALTTGRLTLLTQAAAPVFAGLGIDFAIHLVAGYERARADGEDHAVALERAMRGPGASIVTGGATTMGAFFALALAGSDAIAELGWIAGMGLGLVMVAVLVVTPALWSIGERRGWRWMRVPPAPEASRAAWWLAEQVTRRRGVVLVVAFGLTVALVVGIGRVRFDTDVEALMPSDAPSVVAARRMVEGSAFSNELMVAEHRSLPALRGAATRLETHPAVGRVETVAALIARSPRWRARAADRALRPSNTDRSEQAPETPTDVETVLPRLARLADESRGASAEVRRVGSPGVADALARVAEASDRAVTRLRERDDLDADVARFDRALATDVDRAQAIVARADPRSTPVDVDDLPAPLRRRLVREAADGPRYALYAYPTARVLEGDALPRFVEAVREVEPDAVGYPAAFGAFLDDVRDGMARASAVALVVIVLMLAFHFRRTRDVGLALVPITCGALWTLGALGWLGVPLDLANVAALPLVLGVGVDDGVHLVHRRGHVPSTDRALAPLTRALVLTSLTTIAAFGTLALAPHRGMRSFAIVMVLGAASCLVATLVVLPALVRTLRRA